MELQNFKAQTASTLSCVKPKAKCEAGKPAKVKGFGIVFSAGISGHPVSEPAAGLSGLVAVVVVADALW